MLFRLLVLRSTWWPLSQAATVKGFLLIFRSQLHASRITQAFFEAPLRLNYMPCFKVTLHAKGTVQNPTAVSGLAASSVRPALAYR
nr:unnamed protein product [Spirometra erinaceieuropaei]